MRLRLPSSINSSEKSIIAMRIGSSRCRVAEWTARGATRAVIPRIRPMLVILEPSALPMDSPPLPCEAATAETTISGAEVPKPTMVRPIISGETPKLRAVAAAPATKRSAPQTRSTKPTIMAVICNSMCKAISYFDEPARLVRMGRGWAQGGVLWPEWWVVS